jgi:serine/threonine protein phosphatase PrpC
MNWSIDADRALGSSHASGSQACQDNISYQSTPNKNWHSICLSDGAGSAKHSEVASKYVSERFCKSLLDLSSAIDAKGPGSWINDQIISEVLTLRLALKDLTASSELDDYHCTLVGLLVGKHVSLSVHIGDGAIIAGKSTASSKECSAINGKIYTSLPENGEYKNETYFITEPHWLKHLRIKVFGEIDWFVMGSDGGMDVLCEREKLDGNLIAELINNMMVTYGRTSTVKELITSEFASRKTNDDLSCAIGFAESSLAGADLVWDNRLVPAVHLYPHERAQSLAIPAAPLVFSGSNADSISSKLPFLGLYRSTLLIALFSFFVGCIVSYLFQERVANFYIWVEQSVLTPDQPLNEPKANVDPQLKEHDPRENPKLNPSDQELKNDPSFVGRAMEKLEGWWEDFFGSNAPLDPKSTPSEVQVLEQNDA